ncbi:MAG: DUF1192 domain-containing protein [Rhizobiales bacterium]|nr:DUF1192 domain-containing protein [Hyphomicrobiales bacterium]
MDIDEPPKKPPGMVIGESLDLLSLAELEQRIEALESEIARIRAAVANKRSSKTAADAFFRS